MMKSPSLPDEFNESLRQLAASYLRETDPIRQSGFGGGALRWRQEREPLLDAVTSSGTFLDIGCANGFLLESLIVWARDRGVVLDPFGVDQSPELVERARARLPAWADQIFVGNAWDWMPPRQFDYVYALPDYVPAEHLATFVRQLFEIFVTPGGRLILGAYGSLSLNLPPFDVQALIASIGLAPEGVARGNNIALFTWVTKEVAK